MDAVNKESPIPCYYQVYQAIRSRIEKGEYKSGHRLPSERVMSESFGVNRFTVRSAIKKLIVDGYVYSLRRKGYYVKSESMNLSINKNTSYTNTITENNMIPNVEILEMETIYPTQEQLKLFKMNEGEVVWSIYFLRYYNNIPGVLSRSFIPAKRAIDINMHLMKSPALYKTLEKHYGIKPTRASSICEATLADKKESKLLSIKINSPILKVTSISIDQSGEPIEQCISRFRSDIVKISVNFN